MTKRDKDDPTFTEHDLEDILDPEDEAHFETRSPDELESAIEDAHKRVQTSGRKQSVVVEGFGSSYDALKARLDAVLKRAERGDALGVFVITVGPNEDRDGVISQAEAIVPRLPPEILLQFLDMNIPAMVGNAAYEVAAKTLESAVDDLKRVLWQGPKKPESGH